MILVKHLSSVRLYDIEQKLFDGREVLKAPVVMIAQGVLCNVDELCIYYDKEILSHLPTKWNGIPVTMGHPRNDQGVFLSANDETLYEKFVIGKLFNVRYVEEPQGKLKGEIFFYKDKLIDFGYTDLLNDLLEGKKIYDVSTGFFATLEEKQGNYGGKDYSYEAREIYPDHLALLVDETGACSVDDGCGIRNKTKTERKEVVMGEEAKQHCCEEKVDQLIKEGVFNADEREMLLNVTDEEVFNFVVQNRIEYVNKLEELKVLHEQQQKEEEQQQDDDDVKEEEEEEEKKMTMNEFMRRAPNEMRDVFNYGLRTLKEKKVKLIENILSVDGGFVQGELEEMNIDVLEKINTYVEKGKKTADYSLKNARQNITFDELPVPGAVKTA